MQRLTGAKVAELLAHADDLVKKNVVGDLLTNELTEGHMLTAQRVNSVQSVLGHRSSRYVT